MRSLTICLPIHPTEVLSLDEDTCADLVNRFGRTVRQVLSLYVAQSSILLKGAKKGGHIRWHIIKTETEVLSSDFRDGCLKTYSVSVTIDQSVLGVVPDFLDDSELSKLGRAVGDDFDDIRKLNRDQLFCFLQWVQEAKMIESFELQDNKSTAEMGESSGNSDTDFSLRTPPAFINPNLPTVDGTSPSYENIRPHAVDGVDEFDPIWSQITETLEDQSNAEFATPEHVATPVGPGTSSIFDASTYLTPPHSIDSPRVGVLASPTSPADRITQYRSTSTPFSNESPYLSPAMTPTGFATPPGSNAKTPCCPTPSNYATSPPAVESLTPPSLSTSSRRKLLESYRFGKGGTQFLKETENEEILKAETGLLTQGPFRPLQPFLGLSEADASSSLSTLGLPVKWTGKEGAVNYYKLLEAEKDNELVLCPFAKHIAQSLFYLNYRWLDKHIKRGTIKRRRDNITGYHVRRGKYCWTLAACLGAGILLHGGRAIDAIIKDTFGIGQLDIFISFVLRTRPGSVRLFHSLEPVVKAIMLGAPAVRLRPIILADSNAIISQEELTFAYVADQEALKDQTTEERWLAINANSLAEQKIPEILPDF